jgi:hypothetical protein
VNILDNPDQWVGKYVPFVGEYFHPQDLAKTYGEFYGKKTKYVAMPTDEFAKLGW